MLITQIPGRSGGPSPEELRTLAMNTLSASWRLGPVAHFFPYVVGTPLRKRQASNGSGQRRALDADYAEEQTGVPDTLTPSLKIVGDVLKVDIARDRRVSDIASERAHQIAQFSTELGGYLTDVIINDDTSANAAQINGLKKQATTLSRVGVIGNAADGYEIPLGNSDAHYTARGYAIETIMRIYSEVRPTAIIGNATALARLESIAKSSCNYPTITNVFGEQETLTRLRSAVLIEAGKKSDETTDVIGMNETVGENDDCTSLYFVRWGEQSDVSIATTSGVDVRDLGQDGVFLKTMVELDLDLAVFNPKALYRLQGIRIPSE